MKKSKQPPILNLYEMKELIKNQNFSIEEEIEQNIKQLHELGFVLNYGLQGIIIDPKWLTTILKQLFQIQSKTMV